MPSASAFTRSTASSMVESGCLMPMLWTSKPLLVRMMSTRFLPMSWTSPLTVASTMRAFACPVAPAFSMCGCRIATAFFMTPALCRTNGSCILPSPKRSPTTFMPARRCSLMISSGPYFSRPRLSVPSRSLSSPSMMCRCSASSTGRSASVLRTSVVSAPSGKSPMKWRSGSNVSGIPSGRSAPRRSKTSHLAASHCSTGMRFSGRILLACTIAAVSPRARASCRKTLLSTARAAGFRPKLMFESPSRIWHFGNVSEMRRMPSSVSRPRRRSSSLPVAMVKVSGSKKRSFSSRPHLRVKRSWMREAISILRSAVFAMPACMSSSMVSATHAAP